MATKTNNIREDLIMVVPKGLDFSFVCWGFREITGNEEYTGRVVIRSRKGGICSTTPPFPPDANRKAVAKALKTVIPQGGGTIIESNFFLNKGYLNPK